MRAFGKDGSSKSILVDEKMSISDVCNVLADKNHTRLNSKLAVVEHMPELLMGTSANSKILSLFCSSQNTDYPERYPLNWMKISNEYVT